MVKKFGDDIMEENRLMDYLGEGVTQFHVTDMCEKTLLEKGFHKLAYGKAFGRLTPGRYFTVPFNSMLIAWTVGEKIENLRIGAAHTDFPMLKLKSNPDMVKAGYTTLNVEPYGGLIKETWFDRPLGIAGKVVVEGDDCFKPRSLLYDSKRPVAVIPNLAPHLKRGDKEGSIDVAKEMVPVTGVAGEEMGEAAILNMIADEMDIAVDSVLDYDLYLYNTDDAEMVGVSGSMISSPRIDNVSSVAALIDTMVAVDAKNSSNINVIALFDNEEIGSRSKQGADSVLFRECIDRIIEAAGVGSNKAALTQSAFMVSLDVAHGTHPNYSDKSDPTNKVVLGAGPVLKSSASQRYVSDSEASAVITAISRKYGIKLQKTVNKSGMPGGQTLGPIMSSYIPVRAVDMGIPVLAMHSARELADERDYKELVELLGHIFL